MEVNLDGGEEQIRGSQGEHVSLLFRFLMNCSELKFLLLVFLGEDQNAELIVTANVSLVHYGN